MFRFRSGLLACAVSLGALGASATAHAQVFNENVHIETGNTPLVRLIQTDATWPPYAWDVAANESNFFVRDRVADTLPFQIRPGAPQGSVQITSEGEVLMPGGATFANRATEIVTQGRITDKTGVGPGQILRAIRSLPVPEWQFDLGPDDDRHIGPLAEDFNAAFGLGSDEKVAPGDVAGVALAAAKGLERHNRKLRKKVSKLGKKVSKQSKLLRKLQRQID